MKLITVFTPTYNRKELLERTYKSLIVQTSKNFIWLIVDDGSSDGTEEVVNLWKKQDNGFEIVYVYKQNGGMHTAHNLAYKNITTELNVCIDSDDMMPPNAIELIEEFWLKNKCEDVAGIVALDSDFEGNILGGKIDSKIKKATTLELYNKYKTTGDKKFIYRTDIITSVEEYPEYPGEKLVPLGYKYNLVAKSYPMLILNEVVCLVEYQASGSTNNIIKQYVKSCNGYADSKCLNLSFKQNFKREIKDVLLYIACSIIARRKNIVKNSPKKFLTVILFPLGFIGSRFIINKCKKLEKKA